MSSIKTTKKILISSFLLNIILAIYFIVHFWNLGNIISNYKSSFGFFIFPFVQIIWGLISLFYLRHVVNKSRIGIVSGYPKTISWVLLLLAPVILFLLRNVMLNTYFSV